MPTWWTLELGKWDAVETLTTEFSVRLQCDIYFAFNHSFLNFFKNSSSSILESRFYAVVNSTRHEIY